MKKIIGAALLFVVAASGCKDGSEPLRPTTVQVAGGGVTSASGLALDEAPTFTVRDQHGDPLGGVSVTIVVTGGGGAITGAPTKSTAGATPVGTWVLGPAVGPNELTITIEGLEPVKIVATGIAGPPAKFNPQTPLAGVGQVATAVTPAPRATLTDAFDNPIANATVEISISGGSTSTTSVTTGPDGVVTVADWTLGTTRGEHTLTMAANGVTMTFTILARAGPPTSMDVISGGAQTALAGTPLPQAIRFSLSDTFGNPVDGTAVGFAVAGGGGEVAAATAVTDDNGVVTAPVWRLGKRASPQVLRATAGALTVDVTATVQTDYQIEVRFFGEPMSPQRQARFISAAQRLSAIVTGDLPAVAATNTDLAPCGITGVAPLNELIDDLVIYATVRPIDGSGSVLASAGPCYIRSGGGLPVIGVMQFDVADVGTMEAAGTFEDVITHEMLHVMGFGIELYWNSLLLLDRSTPNVRFIGPQARQACFDSGGILSCTSSVPVESLGGPGTANSHWRESTFDTELMTGNAESGGPMPLSLITIGSLADIGYQTNPNAPDDYFLPGAGSRASPAVVDRDGWEHLEHPIFELGATGQAIPLPPSEADPEGR